MTVNQQEQWIINFWLQLDPPLATSTRIAEPLHQLTRKTAKGFHWNSQCQQAFDTFKHKLENPPILAYPRFDTPFKLQTDASNVAIGGVLSQEQDGSERVIAYWSRQLGDMNELREAQAADIKISNTIEAIRQGNPINRQTCLRGNFFIQNGELCRKFRESRGAPVITQIVLPPSLRRKVLSHLQLGHLGVTKTLEKVKERFYWPIYVDVECLFHECVQCQRRNPPNPKPQAPFETIRANHPFQIVTWDIMGPLPTSDTGFKYILVITDVFTKWVEAFPLRTTGAEILATIFVNEGVSRFGVPSQLHSDQGANFCGEIINAMCQQLGIDRSRTTAYHPQGNGQVERFNRTLESMLAKVVTDNQKDWDKHLPQVLFAYRTSLHETTKFTPYFLNFGRSPTLPVDIMLGREREEQDPDNMPQCVQRLQQSLRHAFTLVHHHTNLTHTNLTHKRQRERQYRGTASPAGDLKIGDRVWLFVPAVKTGRTKKFASLWRGPYTVLDTTSPVNYRIQLIGTTKTLVVNQKDSRFVMVYRATPNLTGGAPTVQQVSCFTAGTQADTSCYHWPISTEDKFNPRWLRQLQGYHCKYYPSDPQPLRTPYVVQRPQRNRQPPTSGSL